ncbi:hypothetical protein BY996DRAFT_2403831 [Phakopsora pachyrhizi]|nr:hypothetical protein BY996DRAFT_2403831 [Phakopsora pachyrhizi]
MMGVIRELSSRLQTLQKDYNTTRLEANGLKSLLVDNYSVGPGEIDRCLVRSRCQNESSKESSTQVRSSGLRWEVEVNDWEYSQDLNTNCGNLSTGTSAALSSGSANKLDLEDLREAMSENPYFEATSQSSCRSRSLVTSPGSATSPLPSSPGRALNHDVSRSGSSSIRLFNPTNILSSKYRKSGNGPSLPSNVAATQGKDSNSSLPTSPNHSTKNPHKRNPSVGSNLSAASSQNNGIGFRNGNWGFYGWKWHKRGKPAGSLATSAAGDLDGEEQLDCDEERNQVSDQELNLGLSSEGVDQTGESSQLEAVNRTQNTR